MEKEALSSHAHSASIKQQSDEANKIVASPGKEEVLSVPIVMQTDHPKEKQQQPEVEYTRDCSVDFRGNPAIISQVGGHRSLLFTLGCMFLTRVAFDGVATSLVLYLSRKLRVNNSKAASDFNNWIGFAAVFSFIGAIVADSYLGRYITTLGSLIIQMIGFLLLVITTALPSLEPLKCSGGSLKCPETTGRRKAVAYLAIYIVGLGVDTFFICLVSFGADQYDEGHPVEVQRKSLYFSLVYGALSCGGFIGNTIVIYIEQYISYKVGYAISAGFLGVALLLFSIGTPYYRFQKPRNNALTRIVQVWAAAARKWHIKVSTPSTHLYEAPAEEHHDGSSSRKMLHSNRFRFLDKAATVLTSEEIDESQRDPWRLCTITQVEEAKLLFQIAPIWLSLVFYCMLDVQILTLFVEQAATMDNRLNTFLVPPASMTIFQILGVCISTLLYESVFVPIARRLTGHPRGLTMLQRIGVGFILIVFSMISAALVEINRLRIARSHVLHTYNPMSLVPLSIFWLIPQFLLMGVAESFTNPGQLEFFYDQAPESIRGISSSMQFTSYAVGSYLSSFLITLVTAITRHGTNPGWISDNLNNGHMDYFFWLLVFLGALNFFSFLAVAHTYKYKQMADVHDSTDVEQKLP